jgi:hypothetical protein
MYVYIHKNTNKSFCSSFEFAAVYSSIHTYIHINMCTYMLIEESRQKSICHPTHLHLHTHASATTHTCTCLHMHQLSHTPALAYTCISYHTHLHLHTHASAITHTCTSLYMFSMSFMSFVYNFCSSRVCCSRCDNPLFTSFSRLSTSSRAALCLCMYVDMYVCVCVCVCVRVYYIHAIHTYIVSVSPNAALSCLVPVYVC